MATRKKPQANKLGSFEDELVLLTSEGLQLQRASAGEIDIITYAREILEVKLWPTQSAILKALYKLPLTTGYWRDCLSTDPIYDDEGEVLYELGELEAAGFEWDAMYDEREILENWKRSGKTTWVEGSKYNELVLECGMRGSKCVTGDTLISVEGRGTIRIDELVPPASSQETITTAPQGTRVWTRTGWQDVSHYLSRPAEQIRRIKTRHGFELGASLVHPILVMSKEGQLVWRKTPDLRVGDFVVLQRGGSFGSENDPEWARLMGYLMGDGCLTGDRNVTLHSEDDEIINDFVALSTDLLDYVPGITRDKRRERLVALRICGLANRKKIEARGGKQTDSFGKSVPSFVMNGDRETVRNFLRGLFDTDGCAAKKKGSNRVVFSTVSKTLAHQVQQLLLKFEIVANLVLRNVNYTKKDGSQSFVYALRMDGNEAATFYEQIGFGLTRKQSIYEPKDWSATGVNSIPHLTQMLTRLKKLEGMSKRGSGRRELWEGIRKQCTNQLRNASGVEAGITFSLLPQVIEYFDGVKGAEKEVAYLRSIQEQKLFFDPIVEIEDGFEAVYDICVPNGHEFITNGIVSHNTSLTSIPATYEFYKLFRHDDPAKAMGLLKGSLILMMVLATGEDQAKDTLFAAIKGRIESSSFFKGFIDNDEIRVTSLEIYCPKKNLKIMAGHSNCVAKGTLIATNRGLVPIEEIVGEGEPNLNIPVRRWKALLPNGGQAPILMGHRKGRQDSIITRTQRGYEVEASKEHRFMTMRDGQLDWTPLGDLREGSWVTLARGWQGGAAPFQSSVRMERHGQVLSVDKLGTDLARHVGHLVGDGSFTQNKEPGSFQLTCGNPEPLELAEALIKRHFIKNPPALYKQTAPSGKNALIKWDSIVHAEWFRSIGLERADVFRKKVPWAIMQGPSELRGAFLGGLIDTDGTVDTGRPRIRWTSASPGLGHTMQLLLLSLGIEASRFSFPRKEREREGRLSVEQAHDRVYIERAMLPIFQRLVGLTVGKKKEKLAEYVTDSKHVRGKPWVPYELVRDSVVALYDAAAAESRTVRQAWNKLKKDTLKPCLEPQVINYDLLKQVLDDVRYFMETKNEDGALKERYEALVWLNDTRPVWDRIVSLTPSQVELFDITVEEAHHFIANGFIVHNSGGLVGRTLMFFGLDEANRFGNEGKGGATGMELYANVGKGTMTLRSRGSKKFVISSAWMQGDMTEQLYELAERKSKNILAFRLATWDVNPRFILLGEQHPEIQQEYATRPVEAQRDYGGVRPGASEVFFPEACITPAFRSPKHVVPIEKRYSYQGPEEMQYLTRLEIVIPADMQVDRYESYAHADPGLKNDSFGLVVARPERLANGRMRIIVDAVLEWRPKKTTTENWIVDYENVKENLFKMKSALRLTRVTTDHWNSAQILQQLQAGGIHAKIFKSSSFGQKIQKEIYTELRNWLNEGMVILPKLGTSPSVDRLHKELKELQLINGKRIDHPSGGSKDLADSLAAVVYNLAKHHNRFGGMGTSATLASTSKVQRGGTVRQATTINQDLNRMRQEYGAPQNLPRVPTRSNWG